MDDFQWTHKWIEKSRGENPGGAISPERLWRSYANDAGLEAMNGNIEPLIQELKYGLDELPLTLRIAMVHLFEQKYSNSDYALILKEKPRNRNSFKAKMARQKLIWNVVYKIYECALKRERDEIAKNSHEVPPAIDGGEITHGYVTQACKDTADVFGLSERQVKAIWCGEIKSDIETVHSAKAWAYILIE